MPLVTTRSIRTPHLPGEFTREDELKLLEITWADIHALDPLRLDELASWYGAKELQRDLLQMRTYPPLSRGPNTVKGRFLAMAELLAVVLREDEAHSTFALAIMKTRGAGPEDPYAMLRQIEAWKLHLEQLSQIWDGKTVGRDGSLEAIAIRAMITRARELTGEPHYAEIARAVTALRKAQFVALGGELSWFQDGITGDALERRYTKNGR